jgi:IclR family transcriptional regulator, acetate operon repressor
MKERNVMTHRGEPPKSGTEAATRVADVLLLFLTEPVQGVSAIARNLGLSKAVVHRILQSLESRRLIDYDERTRVYRLGPAIAALGAQALANLDLRTVALPVLRGLARVSGETVTLSALVGSSRIYIDQLVSLKEIKMTVEVGRPFPLHAGASSRAILAFAPEDLRKMILDDELPALTPATITERAELEASLAETARTGLARSRGERQHGAGSVAAPLFGPHGEVVGAISLCGPVDRFDEDTVERFSPLVTAGAQEISTRLGWSGELPGHPDSPFASATAGRKR